LSFPCGLTVHRLPYATIGPEVSSKQSLSVIGVAVVVVIVALFAEMLETLARVPSGHRVVWLITVSIVGVLATGYLQLARRGAGITLLAATALLGVMKLGGLVMLVVSGQGSRAQAASGALIVVLCATISWLIVMRPGSASRADGTLRAGGDALTGAGDARE